MRIERSEHLRALKAHLRRVPMVAVLGARQVGKTTLVRDLTVDKAPDRVHFFDLEDPRDVARLAEPTLALASLRGLVVLDGVAISSAHSWSATCRASASRSLRSISRASGP